VYEFHIFLLEPIILILFGKSINYVTSHHAGSLQRHFTDPAFL